MQELSGKLEKDVKKAWYIVSYITLGVGVVICGTYIGLMLNFDWLQWPLYVLAGIFLLSFTYERFIAPTLRYKYFSYELREEELEIQRGIFIISRTLIPMNRIQHVTTEQGPILKKYRLMVLNVSTAADTHSIKGISEEKAEEMRRMIADLVRGSEDDV